MALFPENTPTTWRRFSGYMLRPAEDSGLLYLAPMPRCAGLSYDPMKNPEELLLSTLELARLCSAPEEELYPALLRQASHYGLPGFLVSDGQPQKHFPFEPDTPDNGANTRFTGRDAQYNLVFSPNYAEPVDALRSWLAKLNDAVLSGSAAQLQPGSQSLQAMVEALLAAHLQEVHTCAQCGKLYLSADPESKTCGEACQFQYTLDHNIENTMRHFKGHLIGGG